MAIPKKFSDEALKQEISNLDGQISRIQFKKDDLNFKRKFKFEELEFYLLEKQKFRPDRNAPPIMQAHNPWSAEFNKCQEEISSIDKERAKIERDEENCQAKKEALEKRLKETTPEQRAKEHYKSLLDAKNGNPNKEKLLVLANEFGEMIDYNDDAKARQQECLDLRKKMLYDEMVRRIREWDLSKEVAQDIEDGYRTSANEFRGNLWQGYADTAELARHCDDRARKLKERREEQERKDEEENERLETVERERQQQIEQRRKTAKIIAMVFSVGFCTIVSGLAGRDDPYGPCLFVSLLIFIATVVEIASEGKSFDREFVSGGCALCVIAPFILAGLFSIVYSFISSGTAAAIVLGLLVGGAMGVLIGALISEIIDKYYEKKRGK